MSEKSVAQNTLSQSKTPKRRLFLLFIILLCAAGLYTYLYYSNIEEGSSNNNLYRILYEASNTLNENLDKIKRAHDYSESETSIRSLMPSYQRTSDNLTRETATTLLYQLSAQQIHIKDVSKSTSTSEKNETTAPEKTIPSSSSELDASDAIPANETESGIQAQGKITDPNALDNDANVSDDAMSETGTDSDQRSETAPKSQKKFSATLNVEDILPTPQAGFSQYLFASKEGEVLASVGHEKTISIVDLTSINRAFLRQESRSLLSMAEEAEIKGEVPLPSYSSHIDITLSYGKYRVFAFPFALDIPLQYEHEGKTSTLNHLYLIGLMPRAKLIQQSTTSWNASLLVVSVVSLLFMLALVRLFLLPVTHSITPATRNLTHLISYAFFIVVLSLLLAYLQKYIVRYDKDLRAMDYGSTIAQEMEHDVYEVFNKLAQYRTFYQTLQKSTDTYKNDGQTRVRDKQLTQIDLLDNFHKGLLSIADTPCLNVADHKRARDEVKRAQAEHGANNNESPNFSNLPNAAVNAKNQFFIRYACKGTQLTIESDLHKANLIDYLNDDDTLPDDAQIIDFFAQNLALEHSPNESLDTYVASSPQANPPLKILNIFLLNKDGFILTPSFYFVENNVLPAGFELSNRDYFKKIRDQKGWRLPPKNDDSLQSNGYNQVFIQRLLNVNNATRGTTISMPLHDGSNAGIHDHASRNVGEIEHGNKRYADVIAADVLLPSISLAKPAPMDMTFMVVDRDNGEVLFHSDASRSLVENLYYSGNHSPVLSQRIRAALDNTDAENSTVNQAIDGFYHGQAGRFFVRPSVIDKWAVVVFYPNDSLDALMTSQFMFLCISFAVFVTFLACTSWLLGRLFDTDKLKQVVNLPATFDTKEMLHISSTLIGIMYCLFTFTHLAIYPQESAGYWVTFIAIGTLLVIFYFGYRGYKLLFESAGESFSIHGKGTKGAVFLALGLGALALVQALYLKSVMTIPLKNLAHYYQYQDCNKLNRERAEIAALGLTRFPNSITKHRMKAAALLKGSGEVNKPMTQQINMRKLKEQCEHYSSAVTPDDFPNALDLISATQDWPWLDSFIAFSHTPDTNEQIDEGKYNETQYMGGDVSTTSGKAVKSAYDRLANYELTMPVWAMMLGVIAITLMLIAWLHFNRVTLWQRLYYSSFFLRHIRGLNLPMHSEDCEQISPHLTLKVDSAKPNGIDLTTLLHLTPLTEEGAVPKPHITPQETPQKMEQKNQSKETIGAQSLACFALLLQNSPCLQHFKQEKVDLPNVKMVLHIGPEMTGFAIEMWDIEVCLEVPKLRNELLGLLMELKSLVLLGKIESLTLYAGFYSLQRVKMKDPLGQVNDTAKLAHADYLSWADCLLDFNVILPAKITQQIDQDVLHDEIDMFRDLACLFAINEPRTVPTDELVLPLKGPSFSSFSRALNWFAKENIHRVYDNVKQPPSKLYSTRYWATINYILLKAGALYRYKWELCSNAEKLALYNLAKGQYINPKNSEMIEHLALAGLIKVERRHVAIINQSFAHFVLHAESPESMSQLVNDGEAGTWKSYRVPLGLLLVLVIGAVALTSGQSLYIIAASLAGVIGTIASLTTSANMLRGHLRE